jgi:hypothetical protein
MLGVDAVRVVRTHFVQRGQMQHHQQQQHQRQCDDMQREEAIERGVGRQVVTHDPFDQRAADDGYCTEQRDDHLGAPERHVAPRQHVAHEGLGHQHQEDQHAEQPDQLAWLLIRAVHQTAEHVHEHDHEEQRSARGVHVADQPAPLHVTHDVLDRVEGFRRTRLVIHGEEDAGDDLVDQHHDGKRTEVVPKIEVLRRVVLGHVLAVHGHQARCPLIDPVADAREYVGH